jgi:3',5'-cyclic-AMP phosphodiesterase
MTVLAHLSDLHLIEPGHARRSRLQRARLALISAGKPLDAQARIARAAEALGAARRLGADHVILTGDVTEDGHAAQFEVLAELLEASCIAPERITVVAGNHDAYSEPDAFGKALQGPLARYRATSQPGVCTVLADAIVKPISTVIERQWIVRAGGAVRDSDVAAIRKLASDSVARTRAVVVAQHHALGSPAWTGLSWFDGVHNGAALHQLLLERTRLHVLHGHTHERRTHELCGRRHAQVFSAASACAGACALRLYKAEDCTLRELIAPQLAPQTIGASRGAPGISAAFA